MIIRLCLAIAALAMAWGVAGTYAAEIPVPLPSPGMEGEPPGEDDALPDDPLLLPEPEPLAVFVDPHCETKLKQAGAQFQPIEAIEGKWGCGIERPLNVRRILPGVSLKPDTQMRCEVALALANWLRGAVLPAIDAVNEAASQPGGGNEALELAGVTHAASYDCRRRNNLPTGKLSQHSVGSAIDIAAFEFSGGTSIPISGDLREGSLENAFLTAVRGSACLYFTTVLGPGSDGYHSDHLHLDLAVRGGGYRYCR